MKKISFILNMLGKIRILPSWLILFIDVVLLIVSSTISYILFKQLGIKFYKDFPFELRFTISLTVYVFFFIVFKTYTGIIRYSTLNDMGRLFKAVFSAFISSIIVEEKNVIAPFLVKYCSWDCMLYENKKQIKSR